MFTKETFDFKYTQTFNKLVSAYLSKEKSADNFYNFSPDLEGYQKQLNIAHTHYSQFNRSELVRELNTQVSSVQNTSNETKSNINLVLDSNTYTVTTGHQLCLFTGPLYFIYKIVSTIQLCEWLKTNFKDKNFVPVYWLAGEDHDFEEINHAHVFGKKLIWETPQSGSVGRFNPNTIAPVIAQLEEILGDSVFANELLTLFKNAYNSHNNLIQATQYIVNDLFGKYGLVCINADNKLLKKKFIPVFKSDIFENTIYQNVNQTINELKNADYPVQVNPREINCFYMDGHMRSRIELIGDVFKVHNTELSFTKVEMLSLIENETEKLSPNVTLRPLYQQTILPNIAYVGGPGELSYWLEYKRSFDNFNILLPILQPRKFILIIEKSILKKLQKLNLPVSEVFKNEHEVIQTHLIKSGITIELSHEKKKLEEIYTQLNDKVVSIDKTISGAVNAESQKAINGLNNIEAKLNRALKQSSETEINQITNVYAKLFPNNIPQERYDNIAMYYSKWGKDFIKEIFSQTKGNDANYSVLMED